MEKLSAVERTFAAFMYYIASIPMLGGFVFFAFLFLEKESFLQKHAKKSFFLYLGASLWFMLSFFIIMFVDGALIFQGTAEASSLTYSGTQTFGIQATSLLSVLFGTVYSKLSTLGRVSLISDVFVVSGVSIYSFVCVVRALKGKD